MTQATPASIGHAAVASMRDLHERPTLDDDREALRRLTIEANIDWRTLLEWWNLWCATACAHAYAHIGDHLVDGQCVDLRLNPTIAKYFWASTDRLVGKGTRTYESMGLEPPIEVEPAEVRAGDIILIATGRRSAPWGDHVAMGSGPLDSDAVPTIAGNETGVGPDGRTIKGVVVGERETDEIARILRVPLSWMVGEYLDVLKEDV